MKKSRSQGEIVISTSDANSDFANSPQQARARGLTTSTSHALHSASAAEPRTRPFASGASLGAELEHKGSTSSMWQYVFKVFHF